MRVPAQRWESIAAFYEDLSASNAEAFGTISHCVIALIGSGVLAPFHAFTSHEMLVIGQTNPIGYQRISIDTDGAKIRIAYREQPELPPAWERRCEPEAALGTLNRLLALLKWTS